MEALGRLGGEDWFALGDRDLATHLFRSTRLAAGARLTEVTDALCSALGVSTRLLPMTDDERATHIDTKEGETIPFQEWLVRRRAADPVHAVRRVGEASATPEVIAALDAADLVVLCPSNPYVSIDPILELDGVVARLENRPVVALSPIVGGRAVKGPLATMIEELASRAPSAAAIAEHYHPFLDGLVVEEGDAEGLSVASLSSRTIMKTDADRARVARDVLRLAQKLRGA